MRTPDSWKEVIRTWNLLKTLVDFGVDIAGSVTLIPYFIFIGAYNLLRDTSRWISDTRLWRIIRKLLAGKGGKAYAFPYLVLVWVRRMFDD